MNFWPPRVTRRWSGILHPARQAWRRVSVPGYLRVSTSYDRKGHDFSDGQALPPGVDDLAGRVANRERARRSQRGVQDVVTLASLVERETPVPEERPHVAGVFEKRLRIGLPLQCDPTVVYALMLAGAYSGKLDGGDLHFSSPYNTYQNRGLPPGPIANPGEAALRAALDPPPTEDFYFVANTEGGHFFSKTLEEHDRNVARYRHLLQEAQDPTVSGADPAHAANKSNSTRFR